MIPIGKREWHVIANAILYLATLWGGIVAGATEWNRVLGTVWMVYGAAWLLGTYFAMAWRDWYEHP